MRPSRFSVPLLIPFVALLSAGLPGCGQKAPKVAASAKPDGSLPGAPEAVPSPPIAEKDCREYADQVVSAVASRNKVAFNALIDWDGIFAVATTDLGAPANVVSGWILEMKQALNTNPGFADAVLHNTEAGGQFSYLRTKISHGRQVIIFRMIGPQNQGVNYIEFIPKQGPDHKIRAANLYPYASGEFMSESIRRALLPAAASQSRSFVEKLVSKEQDFVLDLPKMQPIALALSQGRKKDALKLLDELRSETKKTKMVLLMRAQAAQEADEKVYLAALEEFRTLFPNDPCLDLQLIDYYTLTKKPDEVLKYIDRLDKSVGGDPYLNYLRASLAAERGDGAGARRLAEQVLDQEPSFKAAYYFLIGLSLREQKHDETLQWLKRIHEKLGVVFKDLTTVNEYANFVKSPQYKEWVKYLDQEAAATNAKSKAKSNAKSKPDQGRQPKRVPKSRGSVQP